MSETTKTLWSVRLLGRLKKHGEAIEIAASPGVSAGTLKALIARALRERTGNEAVASLVGVSVLATERGVVPDHEPPPEGATLSILPPACS